ncbi:MAG: DUF4097 family beta strand repeat-containing protein [Bryobacteraceae bacterium]|nr:DUF4097 family beta strand repeat-containing protein [Bryobacteraceae bacterium]
MKRGSLVFPLILILLGGLFLANNLNPDLSLISIVSKYWPAILIVWGLLRAGEIVYTYLRGLPLPRYGLAGGEWFAVVFVSFLGLGLMGYSRFAPAARLSMRGVELFGQAYDYPVAGKAPVAGAQRLLIENLRGNARVVAGDVTEVQVTGRTTVRALNDEEAKRINDRMPLEVLTQGSQIVVRSNQERANTSDARVTTDLEITVPKSFHVECRGRRGDFDIHGITGNVSIESDNAGVRLQDIGGNVTADLRRSDIVRAINIKGNVELRGRGNDLELENIEGVVNVLASYSGDLQFRNLAKPMRYESSASKVAIEKVTGYVRLSRGELTASKLVGPVRISSGTKDVRVSDFTNSLEIDVDRGDIELRPGATPVAKMDVKTSNGDIELALPENAKVDLKGVTNRGETDIDFPGLKSESEGRGAIVRGGAAGGSSVALHTSRGSVTVRKATAGDTGDWLMSDAPGAPKPPKPAMPPAGPLRVEKQ